MQSKHPGTEVGNVNAIVHIWAHESGRRKISPGRGMQRAAMAGNPTGRVYLQKSREYMKH